MLTIHRHAGAREFLERAESWLSRREIEHAMVLQSARLARADGSRYEQPTYWATIEQSGELVGCAYRTPPFKVGMTALPTSAVALVVADLAAIYPGAVGGFSGPEPTVTEVAKAWTARRGGAWSEAANTRQYVLSFEGLPAPPTSGTLRLAGKSELGLAQSWGAAASIDSDIAALDGRVCAALLGAKQLYFWVEDNQPRCMVGILRQTPQSVAVGIVYTPAAFRSKGYAAAALCALDALLEERRVANRFLYINPASDSARALARKLGCRLVQDAVDIDWA